MEAFVFSKRCMFIATFILLFIWRSAGAEFLTEFDPEHNPMYWVSGLVIGSHAADQQRFMLK